MKYKIKYAGLETYLCSLTQSDFQNQRYRPNGIIKEAELMSDIERFDIKLICLNKSQIIDYGMPFLVDALGNDLSVCRLTHRKFKLPTGRLVDSRFDRTIISDCRKTFGSPLNGCWVIPEQFLSKI